MSNLAKNGLEKGYIASFKFGDDLRAERVLQPENLGPELPQPEGGDDLHILAVQSNAVLEPAKASLVQKVAVLERKNTLLVQKVAVLEQENSSLRQDHTEIRQKFDASEKQLKKIGSSMNLRQLLKFFRGGGHGKTIDKKLMAKIREKCPTFDTIASDPFVLKNITSFSVMVIHLASLKNELQKEKKDINLTKDLPREIKSKIAFINSRLSILRTFAEKFEDTELHWNEAIGKGFYSWCLLGADANEMCHPDMSEERLKDMRKNAVNWEYKYEGVELGPVIEAAIKNIFMYGEFKNGASSS